MMLMATVYARRVKFLPTETIKISPEKLITEFDSEAPRDMKILLRLSIARILQNCGKYQQAIEFYSQAIEIADQIKERHYYIDELLARSYEGRGRCKWELKQFSQAIDDLYKAIDGYMQIEQYQNAFNIFQEYQSLYTIWLKEKKSQKYLQAGISFIEKTLPLIEEHSQELRIEQPEDFLNRIYFFMGLGYREIGDFHNAGENFKTAGEKIKNKEPERAAVNFLEAGECFQKANEVNNAYLAYIEVKGIIISLENTPSFNNLIESLRNKYLPLINTMIDFLQTNFPGSEKKFIRRIKKLMGLPSHRISMQSP